MDLVEPMDQLKVVLVLMEIQELIQDYLVQLEMLVLVVLDLCLMGIEGNYYLD